MIGRGVHIYIYIYYIPPPLTVHFSMTRSVRYQPIFNTLYYTLHTEHAYCLSYRFLNNVVITTVIEMVELVEILDRRLGKRSVERVRYVINNLLHLVIVKYGDISLVLCISTRLRLVTILSLLVKYLTLTRVISLIGRAKRAPHWGVQSRFRVIYICCRYVVCRMSVICQINCVGGITYGPRACSNYYFLAVNPVTPVLFISYTLEL